MIICVFLCLLFVCVLCLFVFFVFLADSRIPHVEVGQQQVIATGTVACLTGLSVFGKNGNALVWNVTNIWNAKELQPAHFTVCYANATLNVTCDFDAYRNDTSSCP